MLDNAALELPVHGEDVSGSSAPRPGVTFVEALAVVANETASDSREGGQGIIIITPGPAVHSCV